MFGVGDIHSPLMFVGEAPGADEDEQNEPFVGKAPVAHAIIQTIFHARLSLYRGILVPSRHARPVERQPQADTGGDEDLPAISARTD